jgi:hypothetical protein
MSLTIGGEVILTRPVHFVSKIRKELSRAVTDDFTTYN